MAIIDKLKAIANAIRSKTGKTEMLSLDEMPSEIEGIETGGGREIDSLVLRTIESYSNHDITTLGAYAFTNCGKLKTIDTPNVTTMGIYACQSTGIVNAEFPNLVDAGNFCFANNVDLESVHLPSLQKGGNYLFSVSRVLKRIDILSVGTVGTSCFNACYVLTTLIMRSTTLIPLTNINVFANCHHINGTKNSSYNPQGLKDGYIYVPKALVEEYKVATNWSTLASQFRAIEDYPDVTGG